MNRRNFVRTLLGGGASLFVPKSYFFAPPGGWTVSTPHMDGVDYGVWVVDWPSLMTVPHPVGYATENVRRGECSVTAVAFPYGHRQVVRLEVVT